MATAANPSPDVAQAAALWTFVNLKNPRFDTNAALDVVRSLGEVQDLDTKVLAKLLRQEMAHRGVHLKHTHALEAAAKLKGHSSWYVVNPLARTPLLRVALLSGDYSTREFADWDEALDFICQGAVAGLKDIPSKVLRVQVAETYVALAVPWKVAENKSGIGQDIPAVTIMRATPSSEFWEGAQSGLEAVRRRLEETAQAFLDGMLVAQRMPSAQLASRTRLVLSQLSTSGGDPFEVGRGSEVSCFEQFELLRNERDAAANVLRTFSLDGALWFDGEGHFKWQLCTAAAGEVVDVSYRDLDAAESAKLLHRYRLARRMIPEGFVRENVRGFQPVLQELGKRWRVNVEFVQRELDARGLAWKDVVDVSEDPHLHEALHIGNVLALAATLDLDKPTDLLARPKRSHLHLATDDTVLRTLLPASHHIRYRIARDVGAEEREAVLSAIEELNDSMRLRQLVDSGTFDVGEPMAHLAFAAEAGEFLDKISSAGLIVFVGQMPMLTKIAPEHREPNLAPVAVGMSLYLEIDLPSAAGREAA
jgi:hypothetical protein